MNVLVATPACHLLLLPHVVPKGPGCHSARGNSMALVLDAFAGEEVISCFRALHDGKLWMPFIFVIKALGRHGNEQRHGAFAACRAQLECFRPSPTSHC